MDVVLLLKRILTVLIVPVLLIAGMAIVVAFHDIMGGILAATGTEQVFGLDFLTTLISLLLFIGLVGGVYWWVGEGGPGLFN